MLGFKLMPTDSTVQTHVRSGMHSPAVDWVSTLLTTEMTLLFPLVARRSYVFDVFDDLMKGRNKVSLHLLSILYHYLSFAWVEGEQKPKYIISAL